MMAGIVAQTCGQDYIDVVVADVVRVRNEEIMTMSTSRCIPEGGEENESNGKKSKWWKKAADKRNEKDGEFGESSEEEEDTLEGGSVCRSAAGAIGTFIAQVPYGQYMLTYGGAVPPILSAWGGCPGNDEIAKNGEDL